MNVAVIVTCLIGLLIFLIACAVLVKEIFEPARRHQLKVCCKKYKTTPAKFVSQMYNEIPDCLIRPIHITYLSTYNGKCTRFRRHIIISSDYMIRFYEENYSSVLEDYSLCLCYGHEIAHYFYPQKKKIPLSKPNSIVRIMREVKADIDGKCFFGISQEQAYRCFVQEKKIQKKNRWLFKLGTHPDWDDRCTYILEYPEYNAELEERIKRDYCQKLKCPYSKVAGLTLLDDNNKTQEVLEKLRKTRQITHKSL